MSTKTTTVEPSATDLVPAGPPSTLWQISGALMALVGDIVEAGGEVTAEQMQALNELRGAMSEKAGNILHVLQLLESQAEMAQRIEQQAAAYRKAREKTHERLRGYLAQAMSATGERKIETGTHTITLKAGAESVEVFDLNALPLDMTEEKVEVRPKKAEIKTALKEGRDIPGARLFTGAPYVQIR